MYSIHFPTVDCSQEDERFDALETAITCGRRCGFTFAVYHWDRQTNIRTLAYDWEPIRGGRSW